MKVVLRDNIRTSIGTFLEGQVLPAVSDGADGWLVQIGLPRRGRHRTVSLGPDQARPAHRADWLTDARCADMPTEIWFPERGGAASALAAKRICASCPVVADCARRALANNERHGIFAGVVMSNSDSRERLERIAGSPPRPSMAVRNARERRADRARRMIAAGATGSEVAATLGVTLRSVERYKADSRECAS